MTSMDTWRDRWGDGKKSNSISTYWDDGNISDGDGWNFNWNIEDGWTCSGGSMTSMDTWYEIWGDGKRFNTNTAYCDDGNTLDGDGWSSLCRVETNWEWSGGNSTLKDQWSEIFNQGIIIFYLINI